MNIEVQKSGFFSGVLQFSNLCGTVYKRGNILFSSQGDRVLSPVGNRVSIFDLKRY